MERIADPDLGRYAREKVEVVRDDSLGESGSAVELELSDGRVVRADGVTQPGGTGAPLSLDNVRAKFLAAAERAQMDDWAPKALARLERIEEVPQIGGDLVGSQPSHVSCDSVTPGGRRAFRCHLPFPGEGMDYIRRFDPGSLDAGRFDFQVLADLETCYVIACRSLWGRAARTPTCTSATKSTTCSTGL